MLNLSQPYATAACAKSTKIHQIPHIAAVGPPDNARPKPPSRAFHHVSFVFVTKKLTQMLLEGQEEVKC
jgi:hypothetical protein